MSVWNVVLDIQNAWKMTKDEWHDEHLDDVIIRRKLANFSKDKKPVHPDDIHRLSVESAIGRGDPVTLVVLSDYVNDFLTFIFGGV